MFSPSFPNKSVTFVLQVNYVIHALGKRLENSKGEWLVTLKTLIVFHRLMREVDPTFQEEVRS